MVLWIIDFAEAFFIWNTLQLVVGQTSRDVMVQNIPNPPVCPFALRHDLRRNCTADGDLTLARRQLGVDLQHADSGAILRKPTRAAAPPVTPASLSALYGFKFSVLTLGGQITVPIATARLKAGSAWEI